MIIVRTTNTIIAIDEYTGHLVSLSRAGGGGGSISVIKKGIVGIMKKLRVNDS